MKCLRAARIDELADSNEPAIRPEIINAHPATTQQPPPQHQMLSTGISISIGFGAFNLFTTMVDNGSNLMRTKVNNNLLPNITRQSDVVKPMTHWSAPASSYV